MQMHIQFYLSLIWILLSQIIANAKDHPHWKINVNKTINAKKGSNITIYCTFEIPPELKPNIKVYWKTDGRSSCSKKDNDKRAFAFHPNSSCIDSHFRNRTKLIGKASNGDCSLQIFNIMKSEPSIYLRVSGQDYYSFIDHRVNIKVDGQKLSSPNHTDDTSFENGTTSATPDVPDVPDEHDDDKKLYLSIFLPLLGLLIIAAAGTVAYKMHKRSHMMNRQESGYYVNFRRTLSTPRKSEQFCKTSNKMAPDAKAIDEPVYLNLQTSACQMEQQQQVATIENIYGNVDYTT